MSEETVIYHSDTPRTSALRKELELRLSDSPLSALAAALDSCEKLERELNIANKHLVDSEESEEVLQERIAQSEESERLALRNNEGLRERIAELAHELSAARTLLQCEYDDKIKAMSALREHEARVLEEAVDDCNKQRRGYIFHSELSGEKDHWEDGYQSALDDLIVVFEHKAAERRKK